jgi:predicted acylesterase/phospholipase RssA
MAGVIPAGDECCRFDAEKLEQVVKDLVADKLKTENKAKMADPTESFIPTFVVATSASSADGPAVLFRSYRCEGFNADKCEIWQAARCTSAAPTFFKAMFVDVPAPGGWYIDGGVRFNNPSELALAEAGRIWTDVRRFSLVSIGTGRQKNVEFMDIKDTQAPVSKSGSKSGVISKIPGVQFLMKVMNSPSGLIELKNIGKTVVELSTSAEPVHDKMVALANSRNPDSQLRYHRFNVERGMEKIGLQEWKTKIRMSELTKRYLTEEEGLLKRNACVRDLWKPSGVERK